MNLLLPPSTWSAFVAARYQRFEEAGILRKAEEAFTLTPASAGAREELRRGVGALLPSLKAAVNHELLLNDKVMYHVA